MKNLGPSQQPEAGINNLEKIHRKVRNHRTLPLVEARGPLSLSLKPPDKLLEAGGWTPPDAMAPGAPVPLPGTVGELVPDRSKTPGLTNPGGPPPPPPPPPSLVASTCPRLPCPERTQAHEKQSFVGPQKKKTKHNKILSQLIPTFPDCPMISSAQTNTYVRCGGGGSGGGFDETTTRRDRMLYRHHSSRSRVPIWHRGPDLTHSGCRRRWNWSGR